MNMDLHNKNQSLFIFLGIGLTSMSITGITPVLQQIFLHDSDKIAGATRIGIAIPGPVMELFKDSSHPLAGGQQGIGCSGGFL